LGPGLLIDRGVPASPAYKAGSRGRNINKLFLTGKPRPVGGELHK
jgi:hypothetical protein